MLEKLINDLRTWIIKSFIAAGHNLSGTLIKNVEITSRKFPNDIRIVGKIREYGKYLDRGVPASRIPFSPGSGKKHSLYIEGLIKYVQARMRIADAERAKSAAFAIAHKQLKRGMPIRTGGKGSNWLTRVLDSHDKDISRFVVNYFGRELDIIIINWARKYGRKY